MSDSKAKFEEIKGNKCKDDTFKDAEVYMVDNDFLYKKPERYSSREVDGMDVIDLVKHWNLNFNEGSILKYLLRDKKQDLSDLEKIIDYASREHKYLLSNGYKDDFSNEQKK